jgi:hypothetical protein
MIFVLYSLLALLVVKLLSNIAVPYELLKARDPKRGISLMLGVEWLLLVLSLVVSLILVPEKAWLKPWPLCEIGVAAIVGTYLHFPLAMMVGGLIITRKEKK